MQAICELKEFWRDTCNGCGSVYIHPPVPTTHDVFVPRACRIALRFLISQELLGRLLISTKAFHTRLDSRIQVSLALAVLLTSKNKIYAKPEIEITQIPLFFYLLLW